VRRRRRPSLFLLALLGGIGAFSVLWYVSASGEDGGAPAFGGAYVEGLAGAPSRVNPLFAHQNAADETLAALVFAGLTRLDDRGQAFPDLAETWSVSTDGRSFRFRLRPGLLWQDGIPLTAADVEFTYGLLKLPDLRARPEGSELLRGASVTATGARTVEIVLTEPFAPLPAYLTLGILPAHLLGGLDAGQLLDAPFNQRPIGAGPYALTALTAERALLTANPAYHFEQPFIPNLELRFYPNEGAVIAALREELIDGAFISLGLNPADRVYVDRRAGLALHQLEAGEVTAIYLNQRLPIFQDRRVRQALLQAIDRAFIVESLLSENAAVAESPLAGGWATTTALSRYDFDPVVAALLLDEAGWQRGRDGVRRRDGRNLSITLSANNDPVAMAVAAEVAEKWRAVGVRVTIDSVGTTALVRERIEPRAFEALLLAERAGADPDPYAEWHEDGVRNLTGFQDATVDSVLEEARQAAQPSRRKALYDQFQDVFARELPALPLYVSTVQHVRPTSLRGVRIGSVVTPGRRFWQVQEWSLKTR